MDLLSKLRPEQWSKEYKAAISDREKKIRALEKDRAPMRIIQKEKEALRRARKQYEALGRKK